MEKQTPRTCSECRHFISGAKCRAFDLIPIDLLHDAGTHDKILDNQKGDFVFISDIPAPVMNIYEIRD